MNENFKVGDVLAVKRMGGLYHHYGVYVGNGEVVHFSADDGSGINETNAANADIRKTSLELFAKGDEVYVDTNEKPAFSGEEIAKRAESLIGTQKGTYSLAVNNCEHFVKFCKTGYKTSDQVNNVKEPLGVAGDAVIGVLEGANEVKKEFQEQKVDIKKVQHRFGKKTAELLSTYNSQSYDAGSEANETESVKKWSLGLSLTEKDYNEINREIDVNDKLKADYDIESKKAGFSDGNWFAKKIGEKLARKEEQKEAELSREESELACYEIQKEGITSLQNGLDAPENSAASGFDVLRTDSPENIRNSKILLASGIKKAGSMILCTEVPNDLATPIACGAVDIKKSFADYAEHRNPVKLGLEVTKSVVVSGAQFVKNSFKHPLFYAKAISSFISPVVKRVGSVVTRNPVVRAAVPKIKQTLGGVLKSAGKAVGRVVGKVVNVAKKFAGKFF